MGDDPYPVEALLRVAPSTRMARDGGELRTLFYEASRTTGGGAAAGRGVSDLLT